MWQTYISIVNLPCQMGHLKLKTSHCPSCWKNAGPRPLILAIALLSAHADHSPDQKGCRETTGGVNI